MNFSSTSPKLLKSTQSLSSLRIENTPNTCNTGQTNNPGNTAPRHSNTRTSINSNVTNLMASIPVLEQQLRLLKEQQKKYDKLAAKVNAFQKQLTDIQTNEQIMSKNIQNENDLIEQLKYQIEQIIKDTRRLECETQQVNKQIDTSNRQVNNLDTMLRTLRDQNMIKRNVIKHKGDLYQVKKIEFDQIQRDRDLCQVDIQTVKKESDKLIQQQNKLKKEAHLIEYKQAQQIKEAKRIQLIVSQLKKEKNQFQGKINRASANLLNQEQKYRSIRQQIALLDNEEGNLINQIVKREAFSRETKQKLIRGRIKIQQLSQQLQNADHDLQILNTQYNRETDRLRQMQIRNSDLNDQLDKVSRDAGQVWESLRQTLEIASSHQDIWGIDNIARVRKQAFQIWNQIQSILN